jgi:hypothetical protein
MPATKPTKRLSKELDMVTHDVEPSMSEELDTILFQAGLEYTFRHGKIVLECDPPDANTLFARLIHIRGVIFTVTITADKRVRFEISDIVAGCST